jgi:ABC-2 type transport system ATP-binding protein
MMYEERVQRTNEPREGILAEGLGKRFGERWALRDVDLRVPAGTVLGLLGHNGAGKTTTVRILTTLARPTSGAARVAGHDVVADAAAVRSRIGVAGQSATVDDLLSARANLELVGRLSHLPRAAARRRAGELLERLGLAEHSDRLVKTFSGGMRRRLDLAATLVSTPSVLFLDEPTTGLDPASRNELWGLLRELVGEGMTLLLTTQYLDEADRLADDIVVLSDGRVVASGSPAELKARVGGERIVVTVAAQEDLAAAEAALARFAAGPASSDPAGPAVTVPVRAGTPLLEIARALDAAGVPARDVHRREATLDDVFLSLTAGRAPAPAGARPELAEVAA